jgi:hypothetical protein
MAFFDKVSDKVSKIIGPGTGSIYAEQTSHKGRKGREAKGRKGNSEINR